MGGSARAMDPSTTLLAGSDGVRHRRTSICRPMCSFPTAGYELGDARSSSAFLREKIYYRNFCFFRTLLRRLLHLAQVPRRLSEREVAERLRKSAKLPPRPRIVLLGEQADIVSNREQTLKEPARVAVTTLQDHVVGKPKTAREAPFPRQ